VTDSLLDGDHDAGPVGEDARWPGRRRSATSGRTRERSRSGSGDGGRSGSPGGGSGRGSRRRGDATTAEGPDGPVGPADEELDDPEAVARGICLRALTGAAKTRQQLAELLARKDVPADAAEAVLDRLTEVGLIDDAAFATAWVSSRQAGSGLARRALVSELRAKGVDGEVAAAAVAEVDPQEEWDTARRLVQRKAPAMRRLDRATAERRLVGMLARKGYGGGLAGIVVREALDDLDLADDLAAEAGDPDEPPVPASSPSQVEDGAGDDQGDDAEDGVPIGGARTTGREAAGGLGRRASGRGLGDSKGRAGEGTGSGSNTSFGKSTGFGSGGFGSSGFGGRKPSRRSREGKPNGSGLGGGGAGGIAGQRAASMADEVGEGHWEPIARRGEPPRDPRH
jgi:SOS response regulatory protein OraA/RecX